MNYKRKTKDIHHVYIHSKQYGWELYDSIDTTEDLQLTIKAVARSFPEYKVVTKRERI